MSKIQLPEGWVWSKIGAVTIINPKLNQKDIPDDLAVSFLPMKMVEEVTGKFDLSEIRHYKEVKKGYTFFQDGDVIFAKVTPCMENGKIAVVDHLENGLGFGSTEFHIFRCEEKLDNKYLFFFLVQRQFRHEAEGSMTGAVGLRRVPKSFLENYPIPLPPLPVQQQIVARIEELFSELDAGTQELQTALKRLKTYRQAVLHHYLSNEEWERVKLGNISTTISGYAFSSSEFRQTGEYQVIRMGNIKPGNIRLEEKPVFVEDVPNVLIQKFGLIEGDLVITLTGTRTKRDYGYVAMVKYAQNLLLNQRLAAIRIGAPNLPAFYDYVLKASEFQNQFFEYETGNVGQGNVSIRAVKDVLVPKPLPEVQAEIVAEIEAKLSETDATEATICESLRQAEGLRQSILKQAFEGKLIKQDENVLHELTSLAKPQTNAFSEQLSLF